MGPCAHPLELPSSTGAYFYFTRGSLRALQIAGFLGMTAATPLPPTLHLQHSGSVENSFRVVEH